MIWTLLLSFVLLMSFLSYNESVGLLGEAERHTDRNEQVSSNFL